jgi:hypothetical protein
MREKENLHAVIFKGLWHEHQGEGNQHSGSSDWWPGAPSGQRNMEVGGISAIFYFSHVILV